MMKWSTMFQDGVPPIILIWLSLVQFITASTNVTLDERLCHKTFKMSGIDHYTVTYSGKDKLPAICSVAFTTNDFNKDICVSFDVYSDFDSCDFKANSIIPEKQYDCHTSREELSTPMCSSYLNGITLYFHQIYRRRISRTILFVFLAPKGTGRPEYGNQPSLIDDKFSSVYKSSSTSVHEFTYVIIGSVVGVIAIISICIIICCYCCCKQCCCPTSASTGTVVSRRHPQEVTLTSAPQPVPNQIQMGPAPNYPPGYQYPYSPQSPGYQGYAPVSQHDNRPLPSAPPPPMDSAPPPYPGY